RPARCIPLPPACASATLLTVRRDCFGQEVPVDRSLAGQNDASRSRLRAFVARRSDEDLARPLGNGWTVAAVLAHLAFWDRRAARLLDRWARTGVYPSPADADALNDALLPQWRLLPPRAAADEALTSAEEVDAKIAALSAEMARAVAEARSIALDRSEHRNEHLDELERLFP
ncbi:MAG: hypothetical protein C4346_12870, partial [Chloroflexota bacterium]